MINFQQKYSDLESPKQLVVVNVKSTIETKSFKVYITFLDCFISVT